MSTRLLSVLCQYRGSLTSTRKSVASALRSPCSRQVASSLPHNTQTGIVMLNIQNAHVDATRTHRYVQVAPRCNAAVVPHDATTLILIASGRSLTKLSRSLGPSLYDCMAAIWFSKSQSCQPPHVRPGKCALTCRIASRASS